MLWIIPIGGKGTRTRALGEFKPFIEIKGYKMLFWFLFSIKKNIRPADQLAFITTQYFEDKFKVRKEIEGFFEKLGIKNNTRVVSLPQTPLGVSAALYACRNFLAEEIPVTVICPDRFIDFEINEKILPKTGFLSTGLDFGKEKDYLKIKEGKVCLFAEKKPVSAFCSNGVFIAASGKDLIWAIGEQLKRKIISFNGEYRIGPAFNLLIKNGYTIRPLVPKACYSLGSVSAINYFSSTQVAEIFSQTLPK